MKSVVRFLGVATALLLTLGACSKDNIDYNETENGGANNTGYLALGGMSVTVMEDTDNVTSSSTTRAE